METDLVNEIFSLTLQDMKGEVLGAGLFISGQGLSRACNRMEYPT